MIAGFRVEQLMRASAHAIAYEATQLSLHRTVELVLYDDPVAAARAEAGARRQALLHHPSILSVFEVGESRHGVFVVRRLVRGGSLAGVPLTRRLLEDVQAAVGAAHAAGLVHGDLTPDAVFVDGDRASLAELVVPLDPVEEMAADRRALQRLREGVAVPAAPLPPRRPRRLMAAGALIVTVALVAALAVRRDAPAPAPPLTAGAVALGSDLAAGALTVRDCEGRAPDANSLGCTLVPLDAGGRPVAVPADGVLRGWAVRGARGGVAVQVVRRDRRGAYAEVARSQVAVARDGPQRFSAEVPVRRGDLLGVELQPGAGVGTRAGGAAMRWMGPLEIIHAPRPPDGAAPRITGVLVRFDVVPGARLREPPQLVGEAAAAAPPAPSVRGAGVELGSGAGVRLTLVRTASGMAFDLWRGDRRVARMAVPDADPRGRLVSLEQGFAAADYVRLQWRNPRGGPLLVHGYRVSERRLRMLH